MKSKNLPKLKFKMLNREAMRTDLPLDLSMDKMNKPTIFKPYVDCNSSYTFKSQQVKSTLLSNQLMINELMVKSLIDYPYASPFLYKLSSSLHLSNSTQFYSSSIEQLPVIGANLPTSSNEHALQRSPSHSPISTISSNISSIYTSSTNSTSSFDLNYRPLNGGDLQQPIDLSKCGNEMQMKKEMKHVKELQKRSKKATVNQMLIKCPSCWQLFDQENSLRKHIKSKHQINDGSSFDRIHKCEHCVLAFTRVDMLMRHNRRHTGEKPYECNMCFQNFSRSDHLNTHRINHFGLKMYKCSNCTYASSRRDMVSRHLQTHGQRSDAYVKTDLIVKQLCKKLVHSTPDQIPNLLNKFKLEC